MTMDQEHQNLGGGTKQKINHQEDLIGKIMPIKDQTNPTIHPTINQDRTNQVMNRNMIRWKMAGTPGMGNKDTINIQLELNQEKINIIPEMTPETPTNNLIGISQGIIGMIRIGEIIGTINRAMVNLETTSPMVIGMGPENTTNTDILIGGAHCLPPIDTSLLEIT